MPLLSVAWRATSRTAQAKHSTKQQKATQIVTKWPFLRRPDAAPLNASGASVKETNSNISYLAPVHRLLISCSSNHAILRRGAMILRDAFRAAAVLFFLACIPSYAH